VIEVEERERERDYFVLSCPFYLFVRITEYRVRDLPHLYIYIYIYINTVRQMSPAAPSRDDLISRRRVLYIYDAQRIRRRDVVVQPPQPGN